MTNPLLIPTGLDAPPRTVLTETDAERIANAIEAELAPSTSAMYAGAWRAGRGALFTRVVYPGCLTTVRIGPTAVSRLVQQRANAAGFDGIPVTGHSLRAGHVTTAAVKRPD